MNILFGGQTEHVNYLSMAKKLTKKLQRQGTDDSNTRKRALEIYKEQTENLNIDDDNINTEIIGLLAEEILRKNEFYDLFKGNVRGQKGLIQESQLLHLQQKQSGREPSVKEMIKDPTIVFKQVT